MRIYLVAIALVSNIAIADETYKDIFKIPYIRYTASAEGSLGYGDLDWNIAQDITGQVTPNILSELKFKRLELLGHGLKGEIWVTEGPLKNSYWAMRAHHSAVNKGTVRDSDYAGDNRSGEYKRTEADAVGDKNYEIDSELGYQFALAEQLNLIPVVGLTLKGQRLRIGNAITLIDENNPDNVGSRTSYLDSTYFTRWEGINLGAHLVKKMGDHELRGYARYYRLHYDASANWNLRKDFDHPESFEHSADGDGYSLGARYSYYFTPNWSGAVELSRSKLGTDAGTDQVNFANGSSASSRLNAVNWSVTSGMLALEFHH